jgi:hypothetical protein
VSESSKEAHQLGALCTSQHQRLQNSLSPHTRQGSILSLNFSLESNTTQSKSLDQPESGAYDVFVKIVPI